LRGIGGIGGIGGDYGSGITGIEMMNREVDAELSGWLPEFSSGFEKVENGATLFG
jgi:hypothetical protein